MEYENDLPVDEAIEPLIAKRTAKDSVFTDLFGIPKYLLQLYQALHPEDKETSEENLHIVTMKNILLDQCYNDLGFQVGEKLVVLVEAQSTWTSNIVIRCLLYLAQTYHEYIQKTEQSLYGSKRLIVPKPELYVIYTGDRQTRPEFLSFVDEFFDGDQGAVEIKVKILYGGEDGDIISQYVTFTKVYNEQIKIHGRTRKAVLETIRICKDKNVLAEYLKSREKEVVDIMMTLFDDDYILKTYVADEKREAAKEAAKNLFQQGVSVKIIANSLKVSEKQVEEWVGLVAM